MSMLLHVFYFYKILLADFSYLLKDKLKNRIIDHGHSKQRSIYYVKKLNFNFTTARTEFHFENINTITN